MLHTILIQHRISDKLYYKLLNNGVLPDLKKREKFEGQFYSNVFREYGFNEIILKHIYIERPIKNSGKLRKFNYYYIDIKLNPIKLYPSNTNNIKITKDKHLEKIKRNFDNFISGISTELPSFYDWTLQRIDYTTYIKTPYVKEYIELFHRSDKPGGFLLHYDNKSKRRKYLDGSMYLSNKSTTINFYDKEDQQLKSSYATKEDIENSKNELRYEVQLNKNKTNYIKFSNKFETKELHYFLNLDLARDHILNYYKKTVGLGDFYKLDKAIEKINQIDMTQIQRKKLIDTLKLVNTSRSIWKARAKFNGNKDTFNNYLKQLRSLGISPITIPERWKINFLQNHYKEIDNNMRNKNANIDN